MGIVNLTTGIQWPLLAKSERSKNKEGYRERQDSSQQFLKSIGIATGAVALGARSAESAELSTASRVMTAQAAGSRPVTLTYVNYSIGVDKPMWDSLIAEFNKIHPNIIVKYVPTPGDS